MVGAKMAEEEGTEGGDKNWWEPPLSRLHAPQCADRLDTTAARKDFAAKLEYMFWDLQTVTEGRRIFTRSTSK